MELQWIIRNSIVLLCLVFIGFLILKQEQNKKLNWSLFYSCLWVSLSLAFMNYWCVKLGLWTFLSTEELRLLIPYDIYFIWLAIWGVVIPYFLKGRYLLISLLSLFWADIILMPLLQEHAILELNQKWILGELVVLLVVYLPAHLWVKFSYTQTHTGARSFFQFICAGFIFIIGIPFVLFEYVEKPVTLDPIYVNYLIQLGLIISIPSLIAVVDLKEKGRGTPFPYDPTQKLVRTGVYAYIRNPIQWSLSFIFIPLSIYYQSYYLLLGVLVSVFYTVGVTNNQEGNDLKKRFGQGWRQYKQTVPAWYFLWKPRNIAKGELYYKHDCRVCSEVASWFEKRQTINLELKKSTEYGGNRILQLTYKSSDGHTYKSLKAVASALEHINLAWASLSWFIRLPVISHLLQSIVNSMGLRDTPDSCKLPSQHSYEEE